MTVPYVVVLKGQFHKMIQVKVFFSFPEQSSVVCCCSRISFSFSKTHGYFKDFDDIPNWTLVLSRRQIGPRTVTNLSIGDVNTTKFLSLYYWVVSTTV